MPPFLYRCPNTGYRVQGLMAEDVSEDAESYEAVTCTASKLPTTKFCLPETGFIRLKNIIAPYGPIPVSKSTWWAGVKSKRFPQPIKIGPKITAWRVEDIRALIERPESALT
jgi:prophage regulatory protein